MKIWLVLLCFIVNYEGFNGLFTWTLSKKVIRGRTSLKSTNEFQLDIPTSFIEERTKTCLDFDIILKVLQNSTLTVLGNQVCQEKKSNSYEECQTEYAKVEQLYSQITFLPLRTNMNIWPVLYAIENNLSPPEREDLAIFSQHIEQILELREFMLSYKNQFSLFSDIIDELALPDEFSTMFKDSFDDEGNLNAEKYPVIKKLRKEIETLKGRIIQVIQTLLRSNDMREKLADK
jgi:dsDNA-specific endonuclease/ATPase MutS2